MVPTVRNNSQFTWEINDSRKLNKLAIKPRAPLDSNPRANLAFAFMFLLLIFLCLLESPVLAQWWKELRCRNLLVWDKKLSGRFAKIKTNCAITQNVSWTFSWMASQDAFNVNFYSVVHFARRGTSGLCFAFSHTPATHLLPSNDYQRSRGH